MIRIAFDDGGPGVVYRALRPDDALPFVTIGEADEGYEVVREVGEPDGDGGVTLIDLFEVPEGEDDAFLAGWDAGRSTLAKQRGHLGARLHRAAGPARFRFVEVARWSSPLMVQRAAAPGALYQP